MILIHKKGNPALFENYRPISLLNNLLKIYARILKARLEAGMEQELNNTQYGFRASCSTSYPIHIIRRALEKAEREGSELHCLALDWKMAFDRLKQGQIRKALEKYSVPEDLIAAIEALYSNPAFWTEIDKVRSSTHPQSRGIRQGCTLSPYLFIIAMSSLVEMVQRTDDYKQAIKEGGIPNTELLELLYADDTMIISKKTSSMEKILHRLEQFAPHLGLTFNRTKCVHLRLNSQAVINFADDTEVKIEHEITYLGAKLNDQLNIHKEITAKIQQTMGSWKRLGPYWKKAAIPNRVKILVYDALTRSKLAYGFETATMNDNAKNALMRFN